MRTVATIFAALGLLPVSYDAATADCEPLKTIATISLTPGPEKRREFVPVKVAGTPEQFILDTGGAFTEISGTTAGALNLTAQHGNYQVFDVSGKSTDLFTTASLEIGPLKSSNMKMIVDRNNFEGDQTVAGLLAPDILRGYDVHLDFGSDTMTLLSPDHCEGKVVYWPATAVAVVPMEVLASGHIIVPVLLDGNSVTAMIDTGAEGSTITIAAAESLGLKLGSSDTPEGGELAAGIKTYQHTFKTLDFEGIAVANVPISVIPDMNRVVMENKPEIGTHIPDRKKNENNADMLIGMDILRHFHLYIAYKEAKLYITPATAPKPDSPAKTP